MGVSKSRARFSKSLPFLSLSDINAPVVSGVFYRPNCFFDNCDHDRFLAAPVHTYGCMTAIHGNVNKSLSAQRHLLTTHS